MIHYVLQEKCGLEAITHQYDTLGEAAFYMAKKAKLSQLMGWNLQYLVYEVDDQGVHMLVDPMRLLAAAARAIGREEAKES